MLDGGLQRWKFREYPVYHGPPPTITPQEYNVKFDDRLVRTFDEMVENFNSKKEQVIFSFYLHTVILELFVARFSFCANFYVMIVYLFDIDKAIVITTQKFLVQKFCEFKLLYIV